MKDWKDNSYHKKTKKTQKQNKHTEYKDTYIIASYNKVKGK